MHGPPGPYYLVLGNLLWGRAIYFNPLNINTFSEKSQSTPHLNVCKKELV